MSLSATRIRAIVRKELRDYRRNRFIVGTMAAVPAIFLVVPIVEIFLLPAGLSGPGLDKLVGLFLLYMLIIPAMVPATVSAYAVVGEREQGTLEPLLTTPLRREEFLLGKALAALVPTLVIAYTVFGLFLACAKLFAPPAVAAAIFRSSELLVQLLFTPLLAGWSIWVGIAISARSSDVRVAQQLGTLASLPPLALTSLVAFGVIRQTLALELGVAAALLLIDTLGWRIVSVLFDRERLVTGSKSEARHHVRGPVGIGSTGVESERSAMASATLRLTRKWAGTSQRTVAWQILIDGSVAGSIAAKQTVELPVAPGHHTLRLTSQRHHSPERSFDAAEGQVVSFSCRAAVVWPQYVAALIKPELWISLKQE
jgi:ABC-type transport system involved in multi-copper enzyme maturation permease subunit